MSFDESICNITIKKTKKNEKNETYLRGFPPFASLGLPFSALKTMLKT